MDPDLRISKSVCLLHAVSFQREKVTKSNIIVEIKVTHEFFACWWKDPDPDPYK
jgi:hypothetical protein